MPGIVQVKVVSARDLPIMDRSSELTDAFVEVKLSQDSFRTEVCPKTLHPTWDSPWFKFNVDDEDLQDEPLQIKLMDHDTYSAHDAIGKVYISLNSLIDDESPSKTYMLSGWFPIFDTLHGIRGEVLVKVKLDVLRDQRRFQQSSCGVRFFACQEVPSGYASEAIHGFVEELVVNDDPEYQWIDKIRTPRASNETRQRLFLKLSGELQRRVGLKALETGGNAVIGYQQCFDLEGESGIVVRGIGTCVSLVPSTLSPGPIPVQLPQTMHVGSIGTAADRLSEDPTLLYESAAAGSLISPKHQPLRYNRKTSSSDSEGLPSSPVKTAAGAVQTGTSAGSAGILLPNPPPLSITPALKRIASSSEFPFYTLSSLPVGILRNIGGLVSARSVKLLDKINNPDEPETRDAWWQEVRNEVRSHTRAMGCNVVIGYSESTSICDTLCIFSAMGTAVRVGPSYVLAKKPTSPTGSDGSGSGVAAKERDESPTLDEPPQCGPCHIPYSVDKPPFDIRPSRCAVCNSKLVPSVLLSTGQVPGGVCVRGRGCLIQARVCNLKKKIKGDENAFYISKHLPFLEHKLHSRLLNKLHMTGMNAVFGLKMQVTIGDTMLIGIATGTAVYLEALPPPSRLILEDREPAVNPHHLSEVQAALNRAQDESRKRYQLEKSAELAGGVGVVSGELETSGEEELNELDLSVGKKEMAFIVDVDEQVSDEDLLEIIVDRPLPQGFHASSTYSVPGIPQTQTCGEPKMVTMVMKKQLDEPRQHLEKQFTQLFHKILQALAFRVRGIHPCALTNIRFDVDLPEEEEVQIAVTAMATRLEEADQFNLQTRKRQSEEMIFPMEDGTAGSRSPPTGHTPVPTPSQGGAPRGGGPVWMTSLPVLPGYHVEHYLGIINLFLIKESTSIRENGGLNSFMHVFLLEAHAVTRAQVAALGGNALLSYRLNECVLIEHPHKNQAQCLLNLSGDAVLLRPGGFPTDSGQLPIEFEQEPRTTPVQAPVPGAGEATPVQAPVPGAGEALYYRVTEL